MSLETGGAHPLAREADLRLDTTLPVDLLDVRADIIGDQIVLVLVDLRTEDPQSDVIYLVDWKLGRMTLVCHMLHAVMANPPMHSTPKVHRAPNGTYEGALAVLSSELVLFLKRDTSSLELCRVTSPSPGASTRTPATAPSLRVMRTLALPAFHPDYRVHTAYMQTDRHIERRRRSPPDVPMPSQDPERPVRAPEPLPFHSAPEDMVVGITFLLRLRGPHPVWKKVVTTVSHRALFALAAEPEECPRVNGGCEGEESEGRVERTREHWRAVVPWEEWGPSATRVIAPDSFQWITAHAGQRWLSLESNQLVIRDFSAARVRRARSRARRARVSGNTCDDDGDDDDDDDDAAAANNNNNNNNNNNAAQTQTQTQSVVQGGSGSCFQDDVISSLPFLESCVDAHEHARDMVLTDGERVVAFVRGVSRASLFLFFIFYEFDARLTWMLVLCVHRTRASHRRSTFMCSTWSSRTTSHRIRRRRRCCRPPRALPHHPYPLRTDRAHPAARLARTATLQHSQTGAQLIN